MSTVLGWFGLNYSRAPAPDDAKAKTPAAAAAGDANSKPAVAVNPIAAAAKPAAPAPATPPRSDAAAPVAAPAPATPAPAAAAAAPAPVAAGGKHLFILCHGLHGAPSDLAYLASQLQRALPKGCAAGEAVTLQVNPVPGDTMWANFWSTHAGIPVLAARAVAQVHSLCAQHPDIDKLSILGHSLGGVYARYVAYLLSTEPDGAPAPPPPVLVDGKAVYNKPATDAALNKPGTAAVAAVAKNLLPQRSLWNRTTKVFFATLASPNLGSRQHSKMFGNSATHLFSGAFLQETGKHLMLLDRDGRVPKPPAPPSAAAHAVAALAAKDGGAAADRHVPVPLLVQMCVDDAHLNALRAFKGLYCYANLSGETSVHYSTAAIATFNPYADFKASDIPCEKGYRSYVADRTAMRALWEAAQQAKAKAGAAKSGKAVDGAVGADVGDAEHARAFGAVVGREWEPDRFVVDAAAAVAGEIKADAVPAPAPAPRKLPKSFVPAPLTPVKSHDANAADAAAAAVVAAPVVVSPAVSLAMRIAATAGTEADVWLPAMYSGLSSLPWRRVDLLGRAWFAHTDIVVRSRLWNEYGAPFVSHIVSRVVHSTRLCVSPAAAPASPVPPTATLAAKQADDAKRDDGMTVAGKLAATTVVAAAAAAEAVVAVTPTSP